MVGFGFNSNGRYAPQGLLRERFIPRLREAADIQDERGLLDPAKAWAAMMRNEKPGGHGERSVAVGVLDMALWDAVAKAEGVPLWRLLADRYNGGQAFKITCRDARGVMVTLIADNYYGYCKKEVKTQISFAANLLGGAEEEHAGGAIAFSAYVLGQDFKAASAPFVSSATMAEALRLLGDRVERRPEGHAVDRRFPDVVYVPEDEDYGYTTLQAFYAGKPVICAADSGAVLDWVEDGVTGLVCDGTPEGLAAAIRRLAADPALAQRLGAAGRERIADLSWADVVARLSAP